MTYRFYIALSRISKGMAVGSELVPIPPVEAAEYFGDERMNFDRLDSETKGEHAWFRFYRELGRKRSYGEVCQYFGVSRDAVQKIAGRNDWKVRVRSFDDHLDVLRAAELDAKQIETRSSILAMVEAAEDKLTARLNNLDIYTIQPRDIPAWIDIIAKVKRQAVGLSDAAKKIEISGPNGGPIELVENMSSSERHERMSVLAAEISKRQAELAKRAAVDVEIIDAEIVPDAEV